MSTPVDKTLRLDRTQLGQKRPSGRPPTFLIAIVAGVVAAVVVALVLLPMFRKTSTDTGPQVAAVAPAPVSNTVPVLVAATAIDPRTPITDAMVKVIRMDPAKAPQANGLTSPLDAVDKVSIGFIAAGAPITSDLLNGMGLSNGLAFAFPKSMRAITIPLDPISSVAGFLKPRDHVDIIGTFDSTNNQSVTHVVLQNVLLLATGSQLLPNQAASTVNTGTGNTASDASSAPTSTVAVPTEIPNATVEVTPEDAQKLIIAGAKGKLQLALRAYDDNSIEPIPVTHSSTVTGVLPISSGGAPQRSAPPIPVPTISNQVQPAVILPSITVIKGTDTKTVTVGQ